MLRNEFILAAVLALVCGELLGSCGKSGMDRRGVVRNLGPLLGLALAGQSALAIFEATFHRSGRRGAGAALGALNTANSFGQAAGPLLGGLLFGWQMSAPSC